MVKKDNFSSLTSAQQKLLQLIASLGYVTAKQAELLYSVINHQPLVGIKEKLHAWCQAKQLALLFTVQRDRQSYYLPTAYLKHVLAAHGLLPYWVSRAEITAHNTEAIETIVQGLDTACFKAKLFRPSASLSYHKGSALVICQPSLLTKQVLVNWCQKKGVKEKDGAISCAKALHQTNQQLLGYYQRWYKRNYPSDNQGAKGAMLGEKGRNTKPLHYFQQWMRIIHRQHQDTVRLIDYLPYYTILLKEYLTDFSLPSLGTIPLYIAQTRPHTTRQDVQYYRSINRIKEKHPREAAPASSKLPKGKANTLARYTQYTVNIPPRYTGGISPIPNRAAYQRPRLTKGGKNIPVRYSQYTVNIPPRYTGGILRVPSVKKGTSKAIKNTFVPAYRYPDPNYLVELPKQIVSRLQKKCRFKKADTCLLLSCAFYNLYLEQRLSYPRKKKRARFSLRGRLATSPLQRGLSLTADPKFNLDDFNFCPFKVQFGQKWSAMPFISDQMISCSRHGRRQELFLELDNRTEGNKTAIQKILNYVWYARQYPKLDVTLVLTSADGAIPTKQLPSYRTASFKAANIADRFLRTSVQGKNGQEIRLSTLFEQTANLTVKIDELSNAYLDVADFLLESNYYPDYLSSIKYLTHKMSQRTGYQVSFQSSPQIKELRKHPSLLFSPLAHNLSLRNNNVRGIWRYAPFNVKRQPVLGKMIFRRQLDNQKFTQIVLPGQENDLWTMLAAYNCFYSNYQNPAFPPALTIYPHRERLYQPLLTAGYPNYLHYGKDFNPAKPYYYQPIYQDNLQLHEELRWFIFQYRRYLMYYFKHPANNSLLGYQKAFLHPLLGEKGLPISPPRQFSQLQELAHTLPAKDFTDQLQLNEISLNELLNLLQHLPQAAFALPKIMPRPFNTHAKLERWPFYLTKRQRLSAYDSLTFSARSHPYWGMN